LPELARIHLLIGRFAAECGRPVASCGDMQRARGRGRLSNGIFGHISHDAPRANRRRPVIIG
jgi:hypothetical protein